MLTFWARDRTRGPTLPLEAVIRMNSADIADAFGFTDRGRLQVGLRADINVIDFASLRLELPYLTDDLPQGGRRMLQAARGYVATLVHGVVTRRNDRDTGARPGGLVRNSGSHRRTGAPVIAAPDPV
jgi:N-acyl-D-aspartate/D-glutamate deacylase